MANASDPHPRAARRKGIGNADPHPRAAPYLEYYRAYRVRFATQQVERAALRALVAAMRLVKVTLSCHWVAAMQACPKQTVRGYGPAGMVGPSRKGPQQRMGSTGWHLPWGQACDGLEYWPCGAYRLWGHVGRAALGPPDPRMWAGGISKMSAYRVGPGTLRRMGPWVDQSPAAAVGRPWDPAAAMLGCWRRLWRPP